MDAKTDDGVYTFVAERRRAVQTNGRQNKDEEEKEEAEEEQFG